MVLEHRQIYIIALVLHIIYMGKKVFNNENWILKSIAQTFVRLKTFEREKDGNYGERERDGTCVEKHENDEIHDFESRERNAYTRD